MKNITKGKIMNNLKKIGLSALAGSLAMVSANAVEYTMSGEIASSFQTGKGEGATADSINGKGFGTETDLTFTANGELDNGFTVDMLMGVNTAGALSNSSSQVTLGMGSLGAVRLNHIGGSSANAIDDVMPNAYQETWDGLSDGSNPSFFGNMNASGSIEYRTPAVEYSGVTISGSLLYDPNSGSQSTAAAPKGGANGVRGVGNGPSGESATIKMTHESGLEIGGGIEQAGDDAGLTGIMGNTSQQTGYIKYSMGPVSLGYQESYDNGRHGTGVVGRDQEASFQAIAYTAGDMTVSYGEATLTQNAIGATVATEEDFESIQAAYTMGAMTISAAVSETTGVGGVATQTFESNTLAVSFAF
jgi:outer membrane protein OmpU